MMRAIKWLIRGVADVGAFVLLAPLLISMWAWDNEDGEE